MENKIQNLEDELKVLKNEVQAVLLDIKDTLISGGGVSIAFGGGGGGAVGFGSGGGDAFSPDMLTDGTLSAPPAPQQVIVTQASPSPMAEPVQMESVDNAFVDMPESTAIESSALEGAFDDFDTVDDDITSAETEPSSRSSKRKAEKSNDDDDSPITLDEADWDSIDTEDQVFSEVGEEPTFADSDWSGEGIEKVTAGPQEGAAPTGSGWNSGGYGQPAPGTIGGSSFVQMGLNTPFGQSTQFPYQGDINTSDIFDGVDLSLLAILTPWLSRAVDTVGKQHLEKLIEIYDVSRDMPPRMKEAILMLLDLYEEDSSSASKLSGDATIREGIPLLIELDGMLLRHCTGSFESAVLSILQDKLTSNRNPRSRRASHG